MIKLNFREPNKIFNPQILHHLKDYSHFTEVWYGGASSGKSYGVVQKVVLKSLQPWKVPRKVLWLRKVDRTVADSIYEDVKECLANWGILPYCKINETTKRITLPNQAIFMFRGMQDPERIKSIKGLSDVVMEEASEFTLDDYTQLTLRLREKIHKDKQIFCMFNPVSKLNWTYQKWFAPTAKYDKADTVIYRSTYKDNKHLDKETIKHIEDLQFTNPTYYKVYTLGEFTTLDKLVFPTYTVRRLNPDKPDMRQLPDYFGLDFGYMNDPTAFVHIKVDMKNKVLYWIDEYVKTGLLNNQIADVIKSMGYQKEVITADSAEKKSIAEMKRDGITRIRPSVKGPDSIRQGIAFLQQFKLVVDDRCVKVQEELSNYTYTKDKKTGEYTNQPVDCYNHCIDATRYAVEELNGKGSNTAYALPNVYF